MAFFLFLCTMEKSNMRRTLLPLLAATALAAAGQERVEPIAYGNMDHWVVRQVHESAIIGGNTATLYELGPDQTLVSNEPYSNLGGSPWGNSNIMAKVAGVVKTNTTVYPEARPGAGKCARLETKIEKVKVLGLVDISVIAAGSMFLGYMREPITTTRDAVRFQDYGIPYTKRPKALRFDYKLRISPSPTRLRMTGFGRKSTVEGQDKALVVFYLQKRQEDAQGRITAKRVGTFAMEYDKSTDGWVTATYPILYGDITSNPSYNARHMGLQTLGYTTNSRGDVVEITETGWASPDEQPTHIMLQFTSSNGGAFVGTVGNAMWIDNVQLVF